jgi:hypothetical protein
LWCYIIIIIAISFCLCRLGGFYVIIFGFVMLLLLVRTIFYNKTASVLRRLFFVGLQGLRHSSITLFIVIARSKFKELYVSPMFLQY